MEKTSKNKLSTEDIEIKYKKIITAIQIIIVLFSATVGFNVFGIGGCLAASLLGFVISVIIAEAVKEVISWFENGVTADVMIFAILPLTTGISFGLYYYNSNGGIYIPIFIGIIVSIISALVFGALFGFFSAVFECIVDIIRNPWDFISGILVLVFFAGGLFLIIKYWNVWF